MKSGATDYVIKDRLSRLVPAVNRALAENKERTRREKSEGEQERLIVELQDALAEVKTLSGLLPICSSCKRTRDDKGCWSHIKSYICMHTDAEFMCPECEKKAYAELKTMKRNAP